MSAGCYRLTKKTYRGTAGHHIGGGPGPFSVSIFFEHESAARRTIAKLRTISGYQITGADFDPEGDA